MFKRMTVWAQHFKITEVIIFAVSIFVMNAKNFWVLCVPTFSAFNQHTSRQHAFAHCGKIRFPFGFMRLVDACFRTVFAFGRRRIQKFSAAMYAAIPNRPFFVHGFVIALRAAIFSFVCTARNMRKNTATFSAICRNLRSCSQCHARSAAILRRVFSVFRHRKICATMFARNCVTYSGA